MLSGEDSVDFGELVFAKGRRSRCTTSARRASAACRCATTCCRARPSWWRSRTSSLSSSRRWRAAPTTTATLDRYARAQAKLEHAGGYNWRDRALATLHGLGFRDDADLDRQLDTFSGGELTRASLGRALAGDPDLLLLDEPTNHLDIASLEWLEQHLVGLDAAIVLVAHDRWFLEAVGTSVLELEAGRGRFFAGPWHAWRREKACTRTRARARDRAPAGRDRAPRAVRDQIPGRDQGSASPVAGQAAREDRADLARSGGRRRARVRLQARRAQRPRRVRARGRRDRGRRQTAADRRRAVARARRARLDRRRQRDRQDDADRNARRTAGARPRQAAHRPQRQARLSVTARRGAGRRAMRARCSRRPSTRPGSRRARRARCSAAFCSPARMPRSRSMASRAASAGACHSRSWSTRAPTS